MQVNEKDNPEDDQTENDEEEVCAHLTNLSINKTENKKNKKRTIVVKILPAIVIFVALISPGMAGGYSAILLPQLKTSNESLYTDDEMGSWIASVTSLSSPLGTIGGKILIDLIGLKLTLQIHCIIVIAGWLFIVLCESHATLLVGRLILGFGTGLVVMTSQIYIAETSDPKFRGVCSSSVTVSYALGTLLVYILGTIMHWRLVAGLGIIFPVIALFMYFLLPESPVWLVRHDQIQDAKKACLWLQGNNVIKANQELQQLIIRSENEKLHQNNQSTWTTFSSPAVLKPFIIVNTFNFLQLASGWYMLVLYAVEIASQLGENINEYFAAVLTAGIRLIFTIVACFALTFLGRRPIGVYFGLFAGISAFFVWSALYFNYHSYFTALCLLLYVAFSTMGFLMLPSILAGEMFPARARASAGCATNIIFCVIMFGFAKFFPALTKLLEMHGVFFFFAIASVLCSIWLYFTLPETKGKTLGEIEDYFLQKNFLWIKRNKNVIT